MILIVSATLNEVKPLLKGGIEPLVGIPTSIGTIGGNEAQILVTGVGAVPTTFWLARNLNAMKHDLVVNVGVAGTFLSEIELGDVVLVNEDVFADYGIDNRGAFVSLFESGLCNPNQSPFTDGRLLWPYADSFPGLGHFPKTKGITVATASGSEQRIEDLIRIYSPGIETMECASVFYSCINYQIPFVCFRAISNRVEARDTTRWNLPLAIARLCEQTHSFIGSL